MEFRISDTFADAIARLPAQDQKAVKGSVFDLQMDPSSPGLQFHRIDKSKDTNFWSMRVNRDIRVIVHKTAASLLICYVDHHDKAYAWAERRRIEAHPRTGAVQIVEVRERVEEEVVRTFTPKPLAAIAAPIALPFDGLTVEQLLSVGVPTDWTGDVIAASEDRFFDLASHLPAEAAEALLEFATTGMLRAPTPAAATVDPFEHPDALRRFRVVENVEELRLALDFPWEKWTVFLHPSQRSAVDRTYSGPARVAGSAGTGKTVVALHRAVRLAAEDPAARILLTTFSEPLANALRRKLAILTGPNPGIVPRITVESLHSAASQLYELAKGRRPAVADDDLVRSVLNKALDARPDSGATLRFLTQEWRHIIDPWRIGDVAGYAAVPRLGRKNRMGAKQRERLWPIFEAARAALTTRGMTTWPAILETVAKQHTDGRAKPFNHIIVDEAQDLGVAELHFLAAIASDRPDALFFAGDLGQRIFQQPFSWKSLGVDVRGRSQNLKVNYRTSHQIREAADRLLPDIVRDVDGMAEERKGTVSIFNGPAPAVVIFADAGSEAEAVAAFIRTGLADGIAADEIGIFVRSTELIPRARAAVKAAGATAFEISEGGGVAAGRISIGTMHLAKGLEFKAVVVMACDEDVLPSQKRVETVADEADLDEVYETERQLLYVACTRARDRLLVSGRTPGSEFLEHFSH
ncbi:ATP-dependent DNA helicase Rep [Alphaproteobacteria bacterium SO-S41]|nr:ATP-dependent DNA helicase Rep [Alphaproteobacteria bacterium SO-S41]